MLTTWETPDQVTERDSQQELHRQPAGEVSSNGGLPEDGLYSSLVDLVAIPEVTFLVTASAMLLVVVWAAQPQLWALLLAAGPTLALAGVGLWATSVSSAAAILLVLAAGSLAMELLTLPGYLIHATGGAVALALAGLSLREPWSGAHPGVVLPAALIVGTFTWVCARGSWRATRVDPFDVSRRMVGRELVVLSVLEPNTGQAVVAGHLWTVQDPAAPISEGALAEVTGQLTADVLTIRQI